MEETKVTLLSNGIRVVTKNLPYANSVTLGFWIKTGSINENNDICGISHFLEHMAFKGTEKRSAQKIAEDIESVGGYLNAYTSKEITTYHAKVLKEDVEFAAEILADILQNSTFEKLELEKERNVILQEIAQTYDTPDDIIFDYFHQIAFSKQQIGQPILGSSETVNRITADDLRRYMQEHYTTNNIICAAAGCINHESFANTIAQLTESFPRSNNLHHSQTKLQQHTHYCGGNFFDNRPLEQQHILLGFPGLKITDENYYTSVLFSSILGGGMSSKLFQEAREKQGLVYSIYTSLFSYISCGLFSIYAATHPNTLNELLQIIKNQLDIMKYQISNEELLRNKAQIRASLLMSAESTHSICDQIATQMMIFDKPIEFSAIIQKLSQISTDMIMNYANDLLSSKETLILIGKENFFKK